MPSIIFAHVSDRGTKVTTIIDVANPQDLLDRVAADGRDMGDQSLLSLLLEHECMNLCDVSMGKDWYESDTLRPLYKQAAKGSYIAARQRFDDVYGMRSGRVYLAPINIDALTNAELVIACEHPALHAEVKRYADLARKARNERLAGFVANASKLEARAERIYETTMPKSVRW
jgi:hypothetical protein